MEDRKKAEKPMGIGSPRSPVSNTQYEQQLHTPMSPSGSEPNSSNNKTWIRNFSTLERVIPDRSGPEPEKETGFVILDDGKGDEFLCGDLDDDSSSSQMTLQPKLSIRREAGTLTAKKPIPFQRPGMVVAPPNVNTQPPATTSGIQPTSPSAQVSSGITTNTSAQPNNSATSPTQSLGRAASLDSAGTIKLEASAMPVVTQTIQETQETTATTTTTQVPQPLIHATEKTMSPKQRGFRMFTSSSASHGTTVSASMDAHLSTTSPIQRQTSTATGTTTTTATATGVDDGNGANPVTSPTSQLKKKIFESVMKMPSKAQYSPSAAPATTDKPSKTPKEETKVQPISRGVSKPQQTVGDRNNRFSESVIPSGKESELISEQDRDKAMDDRNNSRRAHQVTFSRNVRHKSYDEVNDIAKDLSESTLNKEKSKLFSSPSSPETGSKASRFSAFKEAMGNQNQKAASDINGIEEHTARKPLFGGMLAKQPRSPIPAAATTAATAEADPASALESQQNKEFESYVPRYDHKQSSLSPMGALLAQDRRTDDRGDARDGRSIFDVQSHATEANSNSNASMNLAPGTPGKGSSQHAPAPSPRGWLFEIRSISNKQDSASANATQGSKPLDSLTAVITPRDANKDKDKEKEKEKEKKHEEPKDDKSSFLCHLPIKSCEMRIVAVLLKMGVDHKHTKKGIFVTLSDKETVLLTVSPVKVEGEGSCTSLGSSSSSGGSASKIDADEYTRIEFHVPRSEAGKADPWKLRDFYKDFVKQFKASNPGVVVDKRQPSATSKDAVHSGSVNLSPHGAASTPSPPHTGSVPSVKIDAPTTGTGTGTSTTGMNGQVPIVAKLGGRVVRAPEYYSKIGQHPPASSNSHPHAPTYPTQH